MLFWCTCLNLIRGGRVFCGGFPPRAQECAHINSGMWYFVTSFIMLTTTSSFRHWSIFVAMHIVTLKCLMWAGLARLPWEFASRGKQCVTFRLADLHMIEFSGAALKRQSTLEAVKVRLIMNVAKSHAPTQCPVLLIDWLNDWLVYWPIYCWVLSRSLAPQVFTPKPTNSRK